jgi:hypothetical protein
LSQKAGEFSAGEGIGSGVLEGGEPEVAGSELRGVFDEAAVVGFEGDEDAAGLEGAVDFVDGRFQIAKPHETALTEDEVKGVVGEGQALGAAVDGKNGVYIRRYQFA